MHSLPIFSTRVQVIIAPIYPGVFARVIGPNTQLQRDVLPRQRVEGCSAMRMRHPRPAVAYVLIAQLLRREGAENKILHLAFYATQCQAADQVALEIQVDQHDWDDGYHGARSKQAPRDIGVIRQGI